MNQKDAQTSRGANHAAQARSPFSATRKSIAVLERGTAKLLECNVDFEKIVGRERAEIRGLSIFDLLAPVDAPNLSALKACFGVMSGNDTRVTVKRPSGESITVRVQAREFELNERSVVHTIWHETSEDTNSGAGHRDLLEIPSPPLKSTTAERQTEAQLYELLTKTYTLTGQAFFDSLVQHLAKLVGVEYVAVTSLSDSGNSQSEFVSYYGNGKLLNEFPTSVESTPEAEVLAKGELIVSSNLNARFLADPKINKLALNAFVGIALRNSDGDPIGILSAFTSKQIQDPHRQIDKLRAFGERAAVELERLAREERIRELLATRAVLIELLMGTLTPKSIAEKLDESIRLISSVRISSLPHAGAIYLHDELASELRRAASQRLDSLELHEFDRSAAEWFADYQSEAENAESDAELGSSHANFIKSKTLFLMPIRVQSVMFGLLALQRVAGRDESSTERNFYLASANILASMLDRERSEKALEEAESKVLRSQRLEAVGQLAGGIAHDFNNLLTAILGNVELLNERIPDLPELASIQRASNSASRLTAQLLAFTRRQVLKPERIDVRKAVEDVAQMLARIIPESITLKITAAPAQFYTVADAGQLQQVLMNLFINARDAMPVGGLLGVDTQLIEIEDLSRELAIPPGTYVQISVTDSGVGIDSNSLQRIYEPFYTTKVPTQSSNNQGTGLGLSVVYGIVKQHGGFIDVQSEPGRGTEFRIFLAADTSSEPVVTEEPAPSASITGTATILIIEDQQDVRDIAARLLESLGYDVHTATGGPEALAMFSDPDYSVDLVLLDVVMPVMSGIETFGKLRKLRPGQLVVFMTGHDPTAGLKDVLCGEGATLLHKPFTRRELGKTIQNFLSQEQPSGQP